MRTNRHFQTLILLPFVLGAVCAKGQGLGRGGTGGYIDASNPMNIGAPGTDEGYVESGLKYVNAGVVFSRLAQQKAASGDVKSLAKQVEQKHMEIGSSLLQDAKALNVKVPSGLTPYYQDEFNKLQNLSGNDFDKAYLDLVIRMQQADNEVMMDEYKPGGSKNDGLKAQAERNSRTLAQLTDQATKLSRKISK